MREYHLMEASYGSNDQEYNDGKVKYIPNKRAFGLVSKIEDDLFIMVVLYLDGKLLITTTSNPDVFQLFNSSTAQFLNPVNINKAFNYSEVVFDMIKTIISKFYNRIDLLSFFAPDQSILIKMEKYLKKPEIKNYLVVKRFEYVEHTKENKAVLITYKKQ